MLMVYAVLAFAAAPVDEAEAVHLLLHGVELGDSASDMLETPQFPSAEDREDDDAILPLVLRAAAQTDLTQPRVRPPCAVTLVADRFRPPLLSLL